MRRLWLIAILTLRCAGYELTGRIEPAAAVPVYLHGATAPFETSTVSGPDGRFRFRKLDAGAYMLAVSTKMRGEAIQTVELTPGTVDAKGRLDIVIRIDDRRLESDKTRPAGATVSATILSIPDSAVKEYQAAQRCLSRRDPDGASAHLSRAVEIAPRFATAWNQLGTMAYQTGRYDEAETKFRRALDAEPEAFEPLVNLGGVLLTLGRDQEAIDYNERAVTRRPNDALANAQLGFSYLDVNNLNEAEKYLKMAVDLDPSHFSHPQLGLAVIYIKRGERRSALEALQSFLDHHPDSPRAAGVRREIAELSR
jgi:tetratricopeptide (TPR) repeat protein